MLTVYYYIERNSISKWLFLLMFLMWSYSKKIIKNTKWKLNEKRYISKQIFVFSIKNIRFFYKDSVSKSENKNPNFYYDCINKIFDEFYEKKIDNQNIHKNKQQNNYVAFVQQPRELETIWIRKVHEKEKNI